MTQPTLEQLKAMPWTTQISHGQKICVRCPELALIGKGDSLTAAFNDFEAKQDTYFREMIQQGLANEILPPKAATERGQIFKELGLFWAKHIVLALFWAVVFFAVAGIVGKQFKKVADQIAREWNFATHPEVSADQSKRFEKFQKDVGNLKPYIREIKKAWKETDSQR